MIKLKGVCIGSGYFSKFHYDAWGRLPQAEIVAFSSLEESNAINSQFKIPKFYKDYREMLTAEQPDFVDVITPPDTHDEICRFAAEQGINIICQKPVAPTYIESKRLIDELSTKVRFIVHENFRYQPWHQEIKTLIDEGVLGKLFNLNFRSRMGDGWGSDAYMARQPYFRDYKRLLIYETGVHYIDIFGFHAGQVEKAYAIFRKLNPVIKGEDFATMILEMKNGAIATWDANRYNENNYTIDRFTFGEYLVEGEKGTIRLYSDGRITIQKLGSTEQTHNYQYSDAGFAGDSCYNFQKEALQCLITGETAKTEGINYLSTLKVLEAVYESAETKIPVNIS